jgi:glycine cleavage system aminomethyltransferase T
MSQIDQVDHPESPRLYTHMGTIEPHPYEYTGWRNESNAYKESCYIHDGLNPLPVLRIKGPDALKFLSDHCINTFENFPPGKGKHAICCNDEGLVISDGIVLRVDEDEFLAYELRFYLPYRLQKGNYDLVTEDLTGKVFLIQLCGPRALDVAEAATGEDLRDIKFIHHRMSSVAGRKVRVLRAGMGGPLAYEFHAQIEDAIPVYNALIEAGEPFDLRKLGLRAYIMAHFEGGFPQFASDFFYPVFEDEEYGKWLYKIGVGDCYGLLGGENTTLTGSMGPDKRLRYRNPVELGWGGMIKFDHEFIGRKALEKIKANPQRKMVTLVWNKDDVVDVYRSQFEPGEPYANMDEPEDTVFYGNWSYHADQVLKDGKLVGISTGRMNAYYYRKMISICSIDIGVSEIGTEVTVLWGEPGARQKKIRAVVARHPYLDIERNENVDVSKLPPLRARR